MARRAQGSDLNLDSLMDALTNVVGILVIVLVLTSLDVSSAVQRIKRVRPEDFVITERDLQEARQEAQDQRDLLAKLQQESGFDEDLARLEDIRKQIEALKQQLAVDPEAELDEVLKLIGQLKKAKAERDQQLVTTQDELAHLKAVLEDTPVRRAPAPKIVRVPNPRAAPKGLTPSIFVCRQGTLLPFEPDKLKEKAKKRAEYVLRPLLTRAGLSGEIDGDKFVEEFNSKSIADNNFHVRLLVANYRPYVQFDYQGGGETAEKFAARSSKYQVALRRLNQGDAYAQFLVWPDSFDVYVQARQICDGYELLAGWLPCDPSYEWRTGLDIPVKIKGKPKPPPRKPRPPGEKPAPPPKPLPVDQID